MITLTLTAEEAETLGYALTVAKRREEEAAAKGNETYAAACRNRADLIESLRIKLDTTPAA